MTHRTPDSRAFCWASECRYPDVRMMGVSGRMERTCLASSSPVISGIVRSLITAEKPPGSARNASTASAGRAKATGTNPSRSSRSAPMTRTASSSSTSMILRLFPKGTNLSCLASLAPSPGTATLRTVAGK